MHPNFLIIGPPKCASTSLHYYLAQHPQVYMSAVKETNFFTHDYNKGIEFYERYFAKAGNAKAVGEATPSYSFLPFAADRIKKNYPQIKLILCFRNPMERAFSNWLMLSDAGVEKATFRDALEINLKQLNYINFEGDKGAEIWDNRRYNIDIGEKWIRTYIQPGMYSQILKNYLLRFNQKQIKYFFLDDFKYNFDETMKDLFAFLEIDNNFVIPVKEEQNYFYNRKVFRILNKTIGIKNTKLLAKQVPKNFKNIFKQKKQNIKEIPKLNNADKFFLWEIYKSDIAELEKFTGKTLTNWTPVNKRQESEMLDKL
ncbi:MAG: sulfotransferase family protein [Chitinophagaceae bacterium]